MKIHTLFTFINVVHNVIQQHINGFHFIHFIIFFNCLGTPKRDPKDLKSKHDLRAKQMKYLEERIKQAEKFALMKKNGVPLNQEQETLITNEEKLRAQMQSLKTPIDV